MSQLRGSVGTLHRARRRALRAFAAVALVAGATVVNATPALAAGSITVAPSTGLVNGQTVTLSGSGWAPGDLVYYCETVPDATPEAGDCGTVAKSVTADNTGSFSVPVVIERIIAQASTFREPVDCAGPADPCKFGAAHFDLSGLVFADLGFATAPPVILPRAVAENEGNSGSHNLTVPVTLSYASSSTVTANWATNTAPGAPLGQADPATDFTPASGTVTFAPGDTAESLTISVNGDNLAEPDETIVVAYSLPVNATVGAFGVPKIVNDDYTRVLPGGGWVTEGNAGTASLFVPLTLSGPSIQPITVQWRTASVSGPPPHADPANDFTVASGVVTFAPGETAKGVTISVNGDANVEPNDWIILSFKNPTNASMGGFWGLGFGVIVNDD